MSDAVDSVVDSVSYKFGPLPAWAWAGIAAAGVSAAILIRRRLNGGAVGDAPEPGTDSDQGTGDDDLISAPFLPGGFVVGGSPVQGTGGTPDDLFGGGTPDAATNEQWRAAAARYLISRGYSGTQVTDVLARYLIGNTLTAQGQAMVDMAIAELGAPPENVPPPSVSPGDPVSPSPGGGGSVEQPDCEQMRADLLADAEFQGDGSTNDTRRIRTVVRAMSCDEVAAQHVRQFGRRRR